MNRIASAHELAAELQQLVAYSHTPNPSRVRLASALEGLASRIRGKEAAATSEDLQKARQLGVDAFLAGKPPTPAMDKAINDFITETGNSAIGAGIPLLKAWSAGWTAANFEAPVEGESVDTSQDARVEDALGKLMESARKAISAHGAGNTKRMFFALLGVIDSLGVIGRAYEVPDTGYLQRAWKSFATMSGGRPSTNF